jgi:hypothetical protein
MCIKSKYIVFIWFNPGIYETQERWARRRFEASTGQNRPQRVGGAWAPAMQSPMGRMRKTTYRVT